eukprot:TRINITY_DN7082_c0_g1_i1.p1 TRINITY_DN7082_c0_g1~~TRINITY_DN7082_c0_g1_i1.p1  ORF type:complete len:111 (+),score=6.33 TRINITY_DN7082_c0_g1_i1:100-432(+)
MDVGSLPGIPELHHGIQWLCYSEFVTSFKYMLWNSVGKELECWKAALPFQRENCGYNQLQFWCTVSFMFGSVCQIHWSLLGSGGCSSFAARCQHTGWCGFGSMKNVNVDY